jgi:hypothetical protein
MERNRKIPFLLLFCLPLAAAALVGWGRECPAQESEWPLEISAPGGKFILYQPQPDSLKNDKLTGRSAVSFTSNGTETPVFGAFWFEARIATDRDERTVTMQEMKILRAKFPHSSAELENMLTRTLNQEIPKRKIAFSLDRLLTSLEDAEKSQIASENLKTDPPKIIFSESPAVLVSIEGLPQLRPLPDTPVMRVVNTPFILLFDPSLKTYYLRGGDEWFSAKDVLGPWRGEPNPPESILAVPLREMGKEGDLPPAKQLTRSRMEKIIVATEPTELIVSNGPPKYMSIPGTDLLFMSNTGSDVFLDINSQNYYIALAGRWYRSASLKGPWAYISADALPAGFAKIPPASPKGNVLVYVAGTQQAKEAVLDAGIPQTAAIKRDSTLNVSYDGPPKFEPVEGTNLRYAVNSPYEIIEYRGRFYACHQGVWYTAEDSFGPWTVATEVPEEVYSIPPSSPLYHVRYVRVYHSTPDVVYVGYYPGYLGWYVFGPTVVFGTGWYYPGWYGPYYYPRPWTWGFGIHFNPFAGWSFGFNFGFVGAGAWIGFGIGGGWWGGGWGCWWGPHGYHPPVVVPHYHPTLKNVAGSGRSTQPHRRDYFYRNNVYNLQENNARRADLGQTRPADTFRKTRTGYSNDIYTDRSGNVHRYSKNGWERREAGGWAKSRPQSETAPQAKASPRQLPTRSGSFEGRRDPGAGRDGASVAGPRSSSPLSREQYARQRGSERANSFQRFRGNSGEIGTPGRSLGGGTRLDGGAFPGGGGGSGFFRGSERSVPGGGRLGGTAGGRGAGHGFGK